MHEAAGLEPLSVEELALTGGNWLSQANQDGTAGAFIGAGAVVGGGVGGVWGAVSSW